MNCEHLLTASVRLPVNYADMSRFFNQPLVRPVCVIHDVVYQNCQNKKNRYKLKYWQTVPDWQYNPLMGYVSIGGFVVLFYSEVLI